MSKPFLYDTVDKLYHLVMDPMPQSIRERDVESAFLLGFIGVYGVVRGLQWTSKNAYDKISPGFHEYILPTLEKICITTMAITPFVYATFDSQGAKQLISEHPVYTFGMVGVYVGSLAAAIQDLKNRNKEDYRSLT